MIILGIALGPASADECLQAVGHNIDSAEPSYNQIWLEWEARIRNRCDESYYTLVTLNFRDSEGERIHQSLTSSMIKKGDTVTLTKRALLDRDVYERIEATDLEVDPEELPNEVQ